MSSTSDKKGKNERKGEGASFEIAVDESKKSEYNITLPLSYDFEFFPVGDNGKSIPVSSIMILGTKTIIKTSGSTSQWKLRVIKPADQSNMDPTGNTQTAGDDECGDRFDDWLKGKAKGMDEKTRTLVQSAQREIIFRKEGA